MTDRYGIDDCIKFLAEYGVSKRAVALALDIRYEVFLDMCKAMPDVKWVERGHAVGDIVKRRKQETKARERRATMMAARNITSKTVYVAFDDRDTLRNLVNKYAVVSKRSVLTRLKLGMDVEKALSMPMQRAKKEETRDGR